MTETLAWQRIGDRQPWSLHLDTLDARPGDQKLTDPRQMPGLWTEIFTDGRTPPAEMIEDLPRGLIEAYADRACGHAYTREADPGVWFAAVAGLDGAWGDGDTADAARAALRESLTGWVAIKRRLGHEIPVIDGLDLNLSRGRSA